MSNYTFVMQLKAVVYNHQMPMNLMMALADRTLSIPYMYLMNVLRILFMYAQSLTHI